MGICNSLWAEKTESNGVYGLQVLTFLKVIIRDAEMFDPCDPATILGDDALTAALGTRAIHVSEIRYGTESRAADLDPQKNARTW